MAGLVTNTMDGMLHPHRHAPLDFHVFILFRLFLRVLHRRAFSLVQRRPLGLFFIFGRTKTERSSTFHISKKLVCHREQRNDVEQCNYFS